MRLAVLGKSLGGRRSGNSFGYDRRTNQQQTVRRDVPWWRKLLKIDGKDTLSSSCDEVFPAESSAPCEDLTEYGKALPIPISD
jgi:hypothetical protein